MGQYLTSYWLPTPPSPRFNVDRKCCLLCLLLFFFGGDPPESHINIEQGGAGGQCVVSLDECWQA